MASACDQRAANVWVARVIPLVLTGIVGYATWVFVSLVCVDYILRAQPPSVAAPRRGSSIAILVVFFLLLLPMVLCYIRILLTVVTDTGYVPRSSQWYESQKNSRSLRRRSRKSEHRRGRTSDPKEKVDSQVGTDLEQGLGGVVVNRHSPRLSQESRNVWAADASSIIGKEVYVCANDGRPIWCSICLNFKPDRAHHCSEAGRCVRKMDHYCPWIGGVVSETSFKFFIQFTTYAMFLTAFVVVVMAIYIAESKKTLTALSCWIFFATALHPYVVRLADCIVQQTGSVNVHWAIVVGLAGLLGIFAGGMSLTSIHLAIINSTTIDNLSRKTKVMQLAVRISLSLRGHIPPTVLIATPQTMLAPPQDPADGQTAIPLESSNSPTEFAILRTSPGDNPWDLGYYRNWKTVMGNHWIDWFVPLNRSPCCDHSGAESAYELGPVVERLKQEAGLITPQSISHPHTRKRRHRRGSRSGHGSAPGSEDTARSDNARSEEKRHRRRKRERRRAMDRRT